jgi:hypothetical protein
MPGMSGMLQCVAAAAGSTTRDSTGMASSKARAVIAKRATKRLRRNEHPCKTVSCT